MDQLALQHAILLPIDGLGPAPNSTFNEGYMQRAIWQSRMKHASQQIAKGYVQTACTVISLVVLLSLISRDIVIRSRNGKVLTSPFHASGNSSKRFSTISYLFLQMICLAAAFSFSVISSAASQLEDIVLLGYLLILSVVRFMFKDDASRTRIYHHVNLMAVIATVLSALQLFLPAMIYHSNSKPGKMQAFKFFFEAAAVLSAFSKPRPYWTQRETTGDDAPEKLPTASPEETCSWFSYYWSYEWITHLIIRGCRRDLCMDDLPPLPVYDAPLLWLKKITAQRLKGGKTFLTLCRVLKSDIKVMMFWSLATGTVEYLAPYAMYRLLGYLENPGDAIVHPFLWIALLFIGPMARSISYQQYIFNSTRLLVRVDLLLIQELFQTAMRSYQFSDEGTENEVSKKEATGETMSAKESEQANLTTLMSYDVDAIDSARDIFYVATAGTASTIIAMTFLYHMLSWPSLLGVLTLLLLTPLPAVFSRRMARIQKMVLRATDTRLAKIAEYLHSIRTIKYFGWETAVTEKITNIRAVEQQRIWKRNVISAAISMAGDLLPLGSLLVMFTVYVLFTDKPLRAPAAFTSLTIVETLRAQFVWLSNVSRWGAQGIESLRRVDRFFESSVELKCHPAGSPAFKNATLRRTPTTHFKLEKLSIAFQEKSLNVVTGPTGCGKTSLLLSLLGETILESGSVTCPPDVAYVPQTAWLQNDTIRQNILFYSPFDEQRYDAVIDACGLAQDLQQLPAADQTHVGEQGSTLSGGQRQRVSLARALYSHAPTLLLDDIFSALDTHTTSIVYERCFRNGLLSDRTVILVTHFLPALQDARLVVSLEHGTVTSIRELAVKSGASSVSVEETVEEDRNSEGTVLSSSQFTIAPEGDQRLLSSEVVSKNTLQQLTKESMAEGRIPRTLSWRYMLLFGGHPYATLVLFSAFMVQIAFFSITYWLSIWTNAYAHDSSPAATFYLSVYGATVVIFLSLQFLNNILFQYGAWTAAKKLHARMTTGILSAPISWFDKNPIGRALNRFGMDTQSVDMVLVDWLRMSLDNGLRFLLRIVSIASIMPIFAVPAIAICTVGFAVGEMYTRAQVSVKRLCAVSYSPVFSHFSDTVAGMTIIRARQGMEDVFQRLLADKLAERTRACEAQYNCNRWVSVRSDFCAASVAMAAGCVAYYKSGSAGLVGFSLTNAIGLSQTILTLVRNMNELEVELNSFQRICEYAEIEPEESLEAHEEAKKRDALVPASWPTSGTVNFQNVTARYSEDGPDVLRNISFTAKPGERIAIVGRTGSGKSTLGLSLLRFTHIASGKITIDGIDVSTMALQRLRRSITLIPQEPVLFSGDVRSNLDPFDEMDETELQAVLSACTSITPSRSKSATPSNSTPSRETLPLTLDSPVAANGENFSQGQRQVLGLARAISRRSKVVILDEATASVDQHTDARIQEIIRREFPGSTIIAIAHRLRTVVDYDRIVVMGGGEVLEMGSPTELIEKRGVFWDMLGKTGECDELVELAKSAVGR